MEIRKCATRRKNFNKPMARLNSRAKAEPLPIGARLSPFSKLVLITFADDLFPWTPEPKIVFIGSKIVDTTTTQSF